MTTKGIHFITIWAMGTIGHTPNAASQLSVPSDQSPLLSLFSNWVAHIRRHFFQSGLCFWSRLAAGAADSPSKWYLPLHSSVKTSRKHVTVEFTSCPCNILLWSHTACWRSPYLWPGPRSHLTTDTQSFPGLAEIAYNITQQHVLT